MGVDRRSVAIGVLAVVAAAAVGVAVGAVAGGPRRTAGQATEPVTAPETPGPPTAIGGDRSTAAKVPAPLPTGPAVPVYVLGGAGTGTRLYREFRPGGAGAPGGALAAAVRMLGEAPLDPDYRTPWQGVPVAGVTRSGAEATVRFGGAPRLAGGGTPALAVQQVVHTVTAADPAVKRVRVVAPGLPAALGAALPRAAPLDVLAPVWLLTPADGGRSGRRVQLTGTAAVFEATVSVEARQGGRVVARGVATATVGAPERGEWSTTLTLPPGDYVIAAYEESAKDGSPLATDTKRVTVTP